MCVNAPEYMETFFAAQKLGCVPVNVNYRYVGAELAYLLDNSDAAALVYHDEFASTVHDALATLDATRRPRVCCRSRTSSTHCTKAARDYDDASPRRVRQRTDREPSGDDLDLPVHGRHHRLPESRDVAQRRPLRVAVADGAARHRTARSRGRRSPRANKPQRCCPRARSCTAPACSSRCRRSSGGGTVVLLDTPRLDADAVWAAIEREQVQVCTIVGDAFARPLLAALDAHPGRYDLDELARDHVVGRHVESRDQARAARAPARRHVDRLARRVGRRS